MSLQFKNVVYYLQILYPGFDFVFAVFTFDCSQGHARQHENAFSAHQMSKLYRGAQPRLSLGPHLPPLLGIADAQSLVFKEGDVGPSYVSADQQRNQCHNRPTGKTKIVEGPGRSFLKH
jgi:hypothetical protein